jgi:hypothetical protein
MTLLRPTLALALVAFVSSLVVPLGTCFAQSNQPDPYEDKDDPPSLEKLSEEAAFARARAHYEASEFKECAEAFADLLDPEGQQQLTKLRRIEDSRIYLAACLLAMNELERSKEQMRMALRANPLMEDPDSLVFPDKVVVQFFSVRDELRRELDEAQEERVHQLQAEAERKATEKVRLRQRIRALEAQLAEQRVVRQNRRWVAWVPFGVGQFQNQDDTMGWLFLTTEALLATTAVASVSVQLSLHAQANGGNTNKNTNQINERLRLAHGIEVASLAALAGIAALGIVEAHLSFRPEVDLGMRPRELDPAERSRTPEPRIAPVVAPLENGATFGIVGLF